MTWDKDIKFPEKKVDDSWKEHVQKQVVPATPKPKESGTKAPQGASASTAKPTSKPFINLVSSLGYQALFHLGEIASPEQPVPEINLEAAKEIIELIASLKDKTDNNLSAEENQLITSLLSELQMKFAQKV